MKKYINFINESNEKDDYDFIYDFDPKDVKIHFDTKKWLVFTPLSHIVCEYFNLFDYEKSFNRNGGLDGGLVFFINKSDKYRNYVIQTGYCYSETRYHIYNYNESILGSQEQIEGIIKYFKTEEYFIAECIEELESDWIDDAAILPSENEVYDIIYDQYCNDELEYLIHHNSGKSFLDAIDVTKFNEFLNVPLVLSDDVLNDIKHLISTYMSSDIFMKKFNIDIKFPNTYSELDKYDKLIKMVDIDDLLKLIESGELGEDRMNEIEYKVDFDKDEIEEYLINKYGEDWYWCDENSWWESLNKSDKSYIESITDKNSIASDICDSMTNDELDDYFRSIYN